MRWSPWQVIEDGFHLPEATLKDILENGQAFRWIPLQPGEWLGVWGQHTARLRIQKTAAGKHKNKRGGLVEFRAPLGEGAALGPKKTQQALLDYFDFSRDYAALENALPWRSDAFLKTGMDTLPHLRILRQPVEETLFCFLCSSTKQIPQIKEMCANAAAKFGTRLTGNIKTLPTWSVLAKASEADLRACKLGYRAKFVHQTAQALKGQPDFFEALKAANYETAHAMLVSLPGVGHKIADCVQLYGLGQLSAFPIDTWIQKTLQQTYGLEGWSLEQLATFGRIHFAPAPGLAQQYLFCNARGVGRA